MADQPPRPSDDPDDVEPTRQNDPQDAPSDSGTDLNVDDPLETRTKDAVESEGGALSLQEEAALRRARRVSRLLDDAVRVPGTSYRVGLDPILGILPVAGDSVSAVLSLYPMAEAYRLGAPASMLAMMGVRVGLDLTVGSVPVLGTLFDAVWKANQRNVDALERFVQER